MEQPVLNAKWRHVLNPKDDVCQVGFSTASGEVIRLNISVECAAQLMGALTDALDATREYLPESPAQLGRLQTND